MNHSTPDANRSSEHPGQPTSPDSQTQDVAQHAEVGSTDSGRLAEQTRGGGLSRSLLFNLIVPLSILGAGVAAFFLFGVSEAPQRPAPDNTPIGVLKRLPTADVTPVRSLEDFGGTLDLSVDGVVVPFREVQVATEVAGQIVYKDPICEAGNYVEEGQLLFRIDQRDYKIEVERLSQLREQEYQQLVENDQEIANTKRLLEVAEQELELLKRETNRLESLPQGFASEGELDQARRAELQALQSKVSAQNQLALLEKRRSRLQTSERLAATQLKAAQLNLDRTEITAPVSGVVVNEDAELNSFIQRGSPIITIEDTSKAEVAISLRMDQLHWVLDQQTSDAATLTSSDATPERLSNPRGYRLPETEATIVYSVAGRQESTYRWKGRLLRYDGIGLDPQTRTMPVRVVVDNPRQTVDSSDASYRNDVSTTLVRGMFVRVDLHIQPRSHLVVLPALALKPGNRVWQFEKDDTVLIVPKEEVEETPEGADPSMPSPALADNPPSAPTPAETEKVADDEAFEPDAWVAGTVQTVRNVRPIEVARLPQARTLGAIQESGSGSADAVSSDQAPQYWICEVPGQRLRAGDSVVTSPLSNVADGLTTAVRVPVEQLRPSDERFPLQPQAVSTAAR